MQKKNTQQSQPVMVGVLERLLDKKLDEQAKMLRKEIHEDIQEEIHFSESRTDIKLMKMEQRIDDNAKKYRDEVLTSNDKIVGELETIRQEQIVSTEQYRDHEERIATLEKSSHSHSAV